MQTLRIGPGITIDESELTETFIRASGPGGQHVNKVSSAVQLRFDVANSPGVPHEVKLRLARLAGTKITLDGVLVINAREHRSQDRNRQAARAALMALLQEAAVPPRPRHKTKTPYGEKLRRLEGKKIRSTVKQGRGRPAED
jgi:ribosome-associated protein